MRICLWQISVYLGADSLCSRLTEKIYSNYGHKLVLAHMPLLMVCLDGLGMLAQKFPNIASTSIYNLRDFLVTPSPILLKLHKQCNEVHLKNHLFKVTGKSISTDLLSIRIHILRIFGAWKILLERLLKFHDFSRHF